MLFSEICCVFINRLCFSYEPTIKVFEQTVRNRHRRHNRRGESGYFCFLTVDPDLIFYNNNVNVCECFLQLFKQHGLPPELSVNVLSIKPSVKGEY